MTHTGKEEMQEIVTLQTASTQKYLRIANADQASGRLAQ